MDILQRYGLTRVINVSGTMTSLGASLVVPEAVADGSAIQSQFVRIDELQARASETIARVTGAEAGCVTACSASGMTLGVAAAMTGLSLARVERLPDTTGMKNEVVIQSGHLINFDAPVEQAIRLAGATVVPLGTAARVETYHLEDAINDRTAAALFVVSHHVVQEGQMALETFLSLCWARDVPVIVDMASEYDLRTPIDRGASLVVYSAHKFLGGPTGGIVAGRKAMVQATYLQNRGIGRQMKVGKEGILGTIAALDAWERRDHEAVRQQEDAHVESWLEALRGTPGLSLERHPDWTGNPIVRLKITVDASTAGLHAWELADRLASGTPAVQVRDDLVEHGCVFLDPCNLRPENGEATIVAERIRAEVQGALERRDGGRVSLSERRRSALEARLAWPGEKE